MLRSQNHHFNLLKRKTVQRERSQTSYLNEVLEPNSLNFKDQAVHDYDDFAHEMIKKDPHAVFPTNIYRQCDGYTVSTKVKF